MGNIVLLDELTINQIAAGEVIERPASVVKEMVENSLDAGATSISVEIQNGGISKIRITDNGKGVSQDDMRLAFERHATSKIRVADDLLTVRTMGFRGEALASIGAIAKVEMISRTKDSDMGNKIVVEGGRIITEEPVGAPIGTTITVENLFFNTPVRYKFLKKDYTEAGYIEDVVTRLALVNPDIAIKLVNAGKTIIQTHGSGDMKNIIYSIYGRETAEAILNVNYEYDGVKVNGVVGKPEIARSNRLYQQFFVNGRYIRDKALTAAAEQAFKGMIPVGKFGFLILNIQVSPEKVDVNVHPAKLEVRFQEENKVFKAVMYAVKEALLQGELVKNVGRPQITHSPEISIEDEIFKPKQKDSFQDTKKTKTIADIFKKISKPEEDFGKTDNLIEDLYNKRQKDAKQSKDNLDYTKVIPKIDMKDTAEPEKVEKNETLEKLEKIEPTDFLENYSSNITTPAVQGEMSVTNIEKTNVLPNIMERQVPDVKYDTMQIPPSLAKLEEEKTEFQKVDFEKMYEKTFGDVPASMKPKEETFKEIKFAESVSLFDKNQKYANYKFVGSAFSTYIMLEIADELYMIDQHAAHERIMYEKVKKNYYSDNEKDSQLMLVPDVINLTHKEMLIARENMDIFRKAGFVVEEFGENTLKLSGVPNICLELDTRSLFLDILDEIDTVARTERQEVEEKFIATVACKSAVKANNPLTEPEVRALMDKLLQLPNPFTCPHGRPTAIKMTKADFEKKFSRRQ